MRLSPIKDIGTSGSSVEEKNNLIPLSTRLKMEKIQH